MKKLTEKFWFGPLIGLIFGLTMSHNVIVGVICAFLGLVVQGGIISTRKNAPLREEGFLATEADFVRVIIGLAAVVIKSDGKIDQQQLNFVETKLRKDYSARRVQKLMELLSTELQQHNRAVYFTSQIAEDFTNAAKIQLMHFLINLSILDGVLATQELNCLKDISVKIELSIRTFDTILAMFKFRHEYERQNSNSKKKTSSQLVDSAYKILGIDKSVTDAEVKKAYRKLAIAHHPDKVKHLGEEFLKYTNEEVHELLKARKFV